MYEYCECEINIVVLKYWKASLEVNEMPILTRKHKPSIVVAPPSHVVRVNKISRVCATELSGVHISQS